MNSREGKNIAFTRVWTYFTSFAYYWRTDPTLIFHPELKQDISYLVVYVLVFEALCSGWSTSVNWVNSSSVASTTARFPFSEMVTLSMLKFNRV